MLICILKNRGRAKENNSSGRDIKTEPEIVWMIRELLNKPTAGIIPSAGVCVAVGE